MPGRNLVVFSDGTGNSSAKLFKTNVWRIYEALDLADGRQLALYDDGVGTASFAPLATLGGAFGFGLKRNVLDLYTFLARNYEPGDRIFAFGFSRGAFTVRVLIGLLAEEALVAARAMEERELQRFALAAFRRYRHFHNPTGGLVKPLRILHKAFSRLVDGLTGRRSYSSLDPDSEKVKPTVAFLGVWDTVDAYGLPMDELTLGWDKWVWPLSFPHINRVPGDVIKACHALAIDDERHTFHPLLWDERGEPGNATSGRLDDERISQVWFAGMHSDVGGSYPDDGMAHTPLVWMAREAQKQGLMFLQPLLEPPDPLPELWQYRRSRSAPIHDSRQGLGGYYRYNPRHMKRLCLDADPDVRVDRPKIHASVLQRIRDAFDHYAPFILPDDYAVVREDGSIVSSAANPFEHPTQAASRCHEQERVWNLVWRRRVTYFATVFASLTLLLAPFVPGNTETLNGAVPTLRGIVGLLAWLLPDAAAPWISYFQDYPWQLIVGLAIIGVLMASSAKLKRSIGDRMWEIWRPTIASPGVAVSPAPEPSDALYRLRTHPAYRGFFRVLTRQVLPTAFGIVMLAGIVFGSLLTLHRVGFETMAVSGAICRETATRVLSEGSATVSLAPAAFCQPSDLMLKAGLQYTVSVPGPVQWSDKSIEVRTADGFSSAGHPTMYLFAPLRRIVRANWLVPIARVGSRGADYAVLGSTPVTVSPRRDAQLFLFANDAVAPWPWDYFYRNNTGAPVQITVSVKTDSQTLP